MLVEDLVFEKSQIVALNTALEDLCLTCAGIGKLCGECEIEHSKEELVSLQTNENDKIFIKSFTVINDDEDKILEEIYFDKNRVMLTQNAIEDLCSGCLGAGVLCFDCKIHQLRRTVASLPIIDFTPKFSKAEKGEKASGGSCGTSCSTGGCKPKKKK